MRFDLIDLQLFLHVVEAGSITGGARAPICAGLVQRTHPGHGGDAGRAAARARPPRRDADARRRGPGAAVRAVFQQLRAHARRTGRARGRPEGPGAAAVQYGGADRIPAGGAGRLHGAPSRRRHRPGRAHQPRHRDAPCAKARADLGIVADTVDLSQPGDASPSAPTAWWPWRTPALAQHAVRRTARPVAFARLADFDHVGLAGDSALFRYLEPAGASALGRTLRARVRLRSFDAVCRMVESGVGDRRSCPNRRRGAARSRWRSRCWSWRTRGRCASWRCACAASTALPRHAQQLVDEIRA